MTGNLRVPPRLEGEQEVKSNSNWRKQNTGVNTLEQVSLEAVINVLIKRGICTEAELFAEENQLRTSEFQASEESLEPTSRFTPVQTHSQRRRHRRSDSSHLRSWAAKRQWTRKLGTLFFGWKWHRKKSDPQI